MRKLFFVFLAAFTALSLLSCETSNSLPSADSGSESMKNVPPTFSSEDEFLVYLKDLSSRGRTKVHGVTNEDLFIRLKNIPEDYELHEIILSKGGEKVPPALSYEYFSSEFVAYNKTVTWENLNSPEEDRAHFNYKRKNSLLFDSGYVGTDASIEQYLQLHTAVPSELYPDIYITSSSPQIQKDVKEVICLDSYGYLCTLRMPYDLFAEEDIPLYTELEYFTADIEGQQLLAVE